jgi:hypothetical protein
MRVVMSVVGVVVEATSLVAPVLLVELLVAPTVLEEV